MGKEKEKPVWRKSYIQIITGKKERDSENIPCEYCGALMRRTSLECPRCGAPRKKD